METEEVFVRWEAKAEILEECEWCEEQEEQEEQMAIEEVSVQ
jgi:hypothetical protein